MSIVHVHVEKTAGVALQTLYAQKYGASHIALYYVRDGLFAPFSISAFYTHNWYLNLQSRSPAIKRSAVWTRTRLRRLSAIRPEDLGRMSVVIGHFTAASLLELLPPDKHSYRSVLRHPLDRMWSHYRYWHAHKGEMGHRYVPQYRSDMSFEEFALLPGMHNYQTQATGIAPEMYEFLGVTERLAAFARAAGLLGPDATIPMINSFNTKPVPELPAAFIRQFEQANSDDYSLYEYTKKHGPQ